MAMTPTKRTLARLRKDGGMASVVEKWNPWAGKRVDLFKFIDIIAVMPDVKGVLAVQACRTADQSTRLAKILSLKVAPKVLRWLEAGNPIEVWGWSLKGARGKRKFYRLTVTPVTMDMIHERAVATLELGQEFLDCKAEAK